MHPLAMPVNFGETPSTLVLLEGKPLSLRLSIWMDFARSFNWVTWDETAELSYEPRPCLELGRKAFFARNDIRADSSCPVCVSLVYPMSELLVPVSSVVCPDLSLGARMSIREPIWWWWCDRFMGSILSSLMARNRNGKLTVRCWKSHARRMFVATLGKIPRFFWFFLPPSSSSSPVPSPLPMLALLASPANKNNNSNLIIIIKSE